MGLENSMFRYADGTDKLLMFFGTLGSIGDGLQIPLMMFMLSDVISSYGSSGTALTIADVDKFALRLFYVAVGVGLAAFVEGLCWARTAERQTSRMRMKYLSSVLKQEVPSLTPKLLVLQQHSKLFQSSPPMPMQSKLLYAKRTSS